MASQLESTSVKVVAENVVFENEMNDAEKVCAVAAASHLASHLLPSHLTLTPPLTGDRNGD